MVTRRRVVLLSEFARQHPNRLEPLAEAGLELVSPPESAGSYDERRLISALDGAWGVIAASEGYTRHVLESTRTLRVIARTGVGYDAIDVDAATDAGVAVLITPGANAEAVADFALALMLACLRRTIEADADVRSGRWRQRAAGRDLFAATVGIVGFGNIGKAVARRLRGFNCRILVVEPFPNREAFAELGVELVTLEEMLPQVDVLTLHVPLGTETHHLIGERELIRMRKHAVVVNTSRGSVVDGAALAAALRAGTIGAAALDVFEQEPLPRHHELTEVPNIVLSSHIASYTEGAVAAVVDVVVAGLVDLAENRVPPGIVNPDALRIRET